MSELTPMMKQYTQMKEKYSEYILMYRLGDFYEMFFYDAIIASKELDIVLTGKDCGLGERAPMCGIPYHSIDNYISRLVSKGYKVSICEQVRDPDTNEVTGREVVRMVTPGTVTDPNMLDAGKNNYIVSVCCKDQQACLCFIDISTGDINLSGPYHETDPMIMNELGKYSPSEICVDETAKELNMVHSFAENSGCTVTDVKNYEDAADLICKQMGKSLEELEISESSLMVDTFGTLLKYLYDTQLCDLSHVKNLVITGKDGYVDIDISTWRNLEIIETLRLKEKTGSLLGVLDKTQTAMGARLLRHFLEKPSTSVVLIRKRQRAVQDFCSKTMERVSIRESLNRVRDIDRLLTKVVYGSINPREMINLGVSFSEIPHIIHILSSEAFSAPYIKELAKNSNDLSDITEYIKAAIYDEPPAAMKDGGIIRDGFNEQVDKFRRMLNDSKKVLADLESREREKTGIKNLKVKFNRVFGYYIEVSNANKSLVPETYIRKQTLTNGERFITPELKEIESELLNAQENVVTLEYELYEQLRKYVLEHMDVIKCTSANIALIDVLATFAEVAVKNKYTCPIVDDHDIIEIHEGRHPVVEQMLSKDMFIPNDAYLNTSDNRMAIITGPNMAGKSTYMRSVALITLMAQIGSFVPASSATIGIVDKVFTRVGASDDLASGQSTFMIEMNEVAYILKNATRKSLLIFDEIGRGTSTFDGMSIARAVLEYVAEHIKSKSLFATHYHELISLEDTVDGVKNYNVAAKRKGKNITFLRKIVAGGTDDSYGIDVARLAGVPEKVVDRAEQILQMLESGEKQEKVMDRPGDTSQDIDLFNSVIKDELICDLKNLDATVLTPVEALNTLYRLSKRAKDIVG